MMYIMYIARSWAGKNAINSFLRKLLAGKKSAFRKRVCLWLWSSAHRLSTLAYRYDNEIINFTVNRSTPYRWHPYIPSLHNCAGILPTPISQAKSIMISLRPLWPLQWSQGQLGLLPLYTVYILQSVPLATSPKPLSSKYSFRLVNIIQIQYIL